VPSIYDQSSTPARVKLAGIVASVLVGGAIGLLPIADRQMPAIAPFVPMFTTTVILIEGLTAFLLAVQFRATKQAYLGGFAGAYGFVMVVAAVQLLVFPDVFSHTGLLGAGPQCAIWLWVIWHVGFALMVLLALLLQTQWAAGLLEESAPYAGLGLLAGGPLLGAVLAALVIRHGATLPVLISHKAYAPLRDGIVSWLVLATIAAAIVACVRITRLRDLLSLWVAVSLVASLGDSLLVLMAGARFSLGWYGGRALSMVSSTVVFCSLVFEFASAYQRLLSANSALTHRVMHDGLTGLFNRAYLDEHFSREIRRTLRERAPLSVLMIDVDHFKQFNDTCGHARGDECLIAIAGALQAALRRPGDFLVRYGGEEFVAVLPQTGQDGATAMAEAMRHEVLRLALRQDPAGPGLVSVSLGVATLDPAREELDGATLLARADAALYEAKHRGRNRAALWDDAHAAGTTAPVFVRPSLPA
jgi:diguanylate cyclase (GGDEF)-like protein